MEFPCPIVCEPRIVLSTSISSLAINPSLKMSSKDLAIARVIQVALREVAACSLDETKAGFRDKEGSRKEDDEFGDRYMSAISTL